MNPSQNKLLPFQLCCMGCKRCCYHCSQGCESCFDSFKQCLIPCCSQLCLKLRQLHFDCPACSICYLSCCHECCSCKFRCTNPWLIQDQISSDLLTITENYDYLGDQKMFSYGLVHILQDKMTEHILVEKIVDSISKQEAKQLANEWVPRLKQRFPHIIQLQYLFQRQVDGFFSKQYRTYLFYDYILESFQKEFEHRVKTDNYFSSTEILSYTLAVLSGIIYLQTQGVNPSHIDLNGVYLTQSGIIKLLDPSFFLTSTPEQNQQQEKIVKGRFYNRLLKRKQKTLYYFAPEQLQEPSFENGRINSCLFTLALKIVELATMVNMKDCFENNQINFDILEKRKIDAAQVLSVDFMLLLNSFLEPDADQRVSLQVAYHQLLSLPEIQQLIMGLPIEFGLAYKSILSQEVPKSLQLQLPLQLQEQVQQQKKKNVFEEILRQQNYEIGEKQETAFQKILKEKDYKLGHNKQVNIKERLELYTPQDSFIDVLEKYRQQPLIIVENRVVSQPEVPEEYKYIRETYPNGCVYEGYKLNNLREGQGKYVHPNGAYYEGQWSKNKMEGHGKFYNNDVLIYDGEWKNDEYDGVGRECNDDPDNMGEVNYQDLTNIDQIWMAYKGTFKRDRRHGKGVIELVNGAEFQGEFSEGVPDGNGKYVNRDQRIIGRWSKGILQ